jgi:hypothetical protein
MLRWVPILVGSAVIAGLSTVGVRAATEQPTYDVITRIGDVEIRRYGPRVAAETTLAGTTGDTAEGTAFERLAGYIFGNNAPRTRIAMTAPVATEVGEKIAMAAPVATQQSAASYTMRFFLPASVELSQAPQPLDPAVRIVAVPGETMAVLRFTGSRRDTAVAQARRDLMAVLAGQHWHVTGTPMAFFYDPPWTPAFLRRNEVAVPVVARAD